MTTFAHCPKCNELREFDHMHDTAHGIPETHMAGTERFICCACGKVIHAGDPDVPTALQFILDKPS